MKKYILLWLLVLLWSIPIYTFAQEKERIEINGEWTNKLDGENSVQRSKNIKLMEFAPDKNMNEFSQTTTSMAELEAAIEEAFLQRKTAFTIDYSGDMTDLGGKIDQAIESILLNNEYLNYDFRGLSYSGDGTSESFVISFKANYFQTAEQVAYVDQKVKQIIDNVIDNKMSGHEKVKAIHDYIVLHVQYDTSYNQGVNAPYFALAEGKTLCNGYAMLMYQMLKEVDIPVRLISGHAGGIGHAWNLVQLDGKWYHLDATWDDPTPDEKGRVVYNYYLVSDEMIDDDHDWQDGGLNGTDQAYPGAYVDYANELAALGYDDLAESLDLHFSNSQFTSFTEDEFVEHVLGYFTKMETEFSIRFVTNEDIIISSLGDLIKEAASQTSAQSWSYSWPEYPRTEENDYIITISNVEYFGYEKEELSYPIAGNYKPFGEQLDVEAYKEWTVKFNTDMDMGVSYSGNSDVYVLNRFGEKLNNVVMYEDSQTLKVYPPSGGYETGEIYYLVIENSLRSAKGIPLGEGVTFKFEIE